MRRSHFTLVENLFVSVLALLVGFSSDVLSAVPIRLSLTIGNDQGLDEDLPLHYATRDAERIQSLLEMLCNIEKSWLLTNQNADRIQQAIAEIGKYIERVKRSRNETVQLLVYYSGHADEHFLHLSKTQLTLENFRNEIMAAGADLTIAVIDACRNRSGGAPKGVRLDEPLDVTLNREEIPRGVIWIQSVREGEVAIESEVLRGSVFTHHWIASLQGAADFDGDGRVSLSEAFTQARSKTMLSTLQDLGQPQHPSYHFDFRGEEDVILTYLDQAETRLVFPPKMSGHFYIAERFNGTLFSELLKDDRSIRSLALPRGEYLVYTRGTETVRVAEVSLTWLKEKVLTDQDFDAYPKSQVVTKGGWIQIRSYALSLGTEVDSGFVDGMSILPLIRLDAFKRVGRFEIILGLAAGQTDFDARDSHIDNWILGCNVGARLSIPQLYGVWLTQFEARPIWMMQKLSSLKGFDSAPSSDSDTFVMQLRLSQQFRLPLSLLTSLSLGVGLSVSGYSKEDHPEFRISGFGLISYQILL